MTALPVFESRTQTMSSKKLDLFHSRSRRAVNIASFIIRSARGLAPCCVIPNFQAKKIREHGRRHREAYIVMAGEKLFWPISVRFQAGFISIRKSREEMPMFRLEQRQGKLDFKVLHAFLIKQDLYKYRLYYAIISQ